LVTIRLADELPAALENKPIQIFSLVVSVSELTERGERFRFDVEKVLTNTAVTPWHPGPEIVIRYENAQSKILRSDYMVR